jgi:hypothetical protein
MTQGLCEDPVTGSAHCALLPYWEQRCNPPTARTAISGDHSIGASSSAGRGASLPVSCSCLHPALARVQCRQLVLRSQGLLFISLSLAALAGVGAPLVGHQLSLRGGVVRCRGLEYDAAGR